MDSEIRGFERESRERAARLRDAGEHERAEIAERDADHWRRFRLQRRRK